MPSSRLTPFDLTIEDAHISDVAAIHDIERRSFDSPWSYRVIDQEVAGGQPHSRVLVARLFGMVVAFAILWTVDDETHIINFAVDPDYRRRGIAQRLLDAIFTDARAFGAPRLTLEVRVSNEAAIRLYRKNGFEIVGVRRKYYEDNREDAFIMWADASTPKESPRKRRGFTED